MAIGVSNMRPLTLMRRVVSLMMLFAGDQEGAFGESEIEIVRICQRMAEFGLGPRHVRQLHSGIQLVAGLLEQVLAPALRSRNAERREQGLDELAQLAGLSAELTELLLIRDVDV